LKEAILRSLPPDNGLYMPDTLPVLGPEFWAIWRELTFQEIGYAVAHAFFHEDVPAAALKEIVEGTLTFDAPLVTLAPGDHILELFHGPTLAFKDFGARFMARLMAWLTRGEDRELTVLVATSGDTGGAVASAFHRVQGTRVIILYPKGKVSGLQEKQLTTLGDNITALEIDGTFDDCQRLVKSAFLDRELSERLNLTSANSINLSRLVPQSFYYIHSARQLPEGVEPVFVIPSGNFGNLTAGLLAVLDYQRAVVIYAPTDGSGTLAERIARGQLSPLFAHQADYAAATNEVPPASRALGLMRATHALLDTRLMMAWSRQLADSGHLDEARWVAQRLRDFRNPDAAEFFAPCDAGAAAASTVWFFGLGFGGRRLAGLFARPATWRILDWTIAATMIVLGISLLVGPR
jgi:threonine synthase